MRDMDINTLDSVYDAILKALDDEELGAHQGVEVLTASLLRLLVLEGADSFHSILEVDSLMWAVQISSDEDHVAEMTESMQSEGSETIH
jgi:hypothetical protein